MRKKFILIALSILVLVVLSIGNTHRILPADNDPCQTDMSHEGYVNQLSMFHCIGHTEYEVNPNKKGLLRVKKWDHLHPWMTLEWHLEKGFTEAHALQLIQTSK